MGRCTLLVFEHMFEPLQMIHSLGRREVIEAADRHGEDGLDPCPRRAMRHLTDSGPGFT